MHKTIVILAGGLSSRMKQSESSMNLSEQEIKQANERTKGLIGVGGGGQRPLLDYLLYNAQKAGYINVIIVTEEDNSLIKQFYGMKNYGNIFHNLEISYAVQNLPQRRVKPFGTADALFQAMEKYPKLQEIMFTVCNSDNLYSIKAFQMILKSESRNAWINYDRDGLLFPSERIARFAITVVDNKQRLLDIIEKPSKDEIEKYRDTTGKVRVSMNLFKFSGKMIYPFLVDCPINSDRDEKELPTAVLNMARKFPDSITGIPFSEHVPDLTKKDDILDVREYLSEHYADLYWDN